MKNITLLVSFLLFDNLLFSQDVMKLSAKVEMIPNPCMEEICLPGLIWGLNVDTAIFVLTKETNWIWDETPLTIYGIQYSVGDSLEIYGQLSKRQDWGGDDFYEFNILNKELKYTEISNNKLLTLVFDFPSYECGIKIFKQPNHYSTSKLTYNAGLDTTFYLYSSVQGFIGVDTIVFLTGCGYAPEYGFLEIIEYFINVSPETGIHTTPQNLFRLFPNPSAGTVNVSTVLDKLYDFNIYTMHGQSIIQGEFRNNLSLHLRQGVYIIDIRDGKKIMYRQKIIIHE